MKHIYIFVLVFFLSFNLYSQTGVIGTPIESSPISSHKKAVESKTSPKNVLSATSISNVNRNYGFTKDGVFYIHRSLIPTSNGDDNLYLCYDKNQWNILATKMIFDGNYYYYQSKIKQNSGSLQYCFYCSEIRQWMPQSLLNENEETPLINKSDIISNRNEDGHNFKTKPQDFFPGDKH